MIRRQVRTRASWALTLGLLVLASAPATANTTSRDHGGKYTVGWTLGVRAIPVTVPVVARSAVGSGPATQTDLMGSLAMRATRSVVGRALYVGWETEMASASTHTPITVDHPATPRGMSFLQAAVVVGVRTDLRPLTLGAELVAGGRLLSRDYEGDRDRDLDGFETIMDPNVALEARVRAGIRTSPRWNVGGVYGTSLVDETWTAGLYVAFTPGWR